ncbi:AAA family ATPase [Lactococcus lactis subsp. lactis]|uniref:ATP-binding protein n=1 Tax=Lactococcus lactis TaxID=1358 RepID=A0AAW7IVV4_9LACT|nr:ATP-binding protein [Lactococcus lactis]KAF0953218.1 AAA family ATPase [Lactococcus lactis subsp. lactis]MCT0062220.1 AAA family ATPase [Lactococcus lactis subsp. lactis]MCT0136707.1 AAA family ATPase [Lactococcus lactis subsp. lactis]MDM7547042.1 ATP-binding protein [Lactococcus lactis]QQB12764.1 AAA family ATPase [Lactococcus lactis]
MKKKNVINLIKYHVENNDFQFRNEAVEIARSFDQSGDSQLAEYIMSQLSSASTFVPQGNIIDSKFLKRIETDSSPLPLPSVIGDDVKGIINAINHNLGINKFLFEGAPGTGKTETAKQIARILERQLYVVEFSELIDSKLGQTAKNIVEIFKVINSMPYPTRTLILFDEIDAIALDRVNSRDLREMGRVTSTILKELDKLNEEVVLIATTNLFENFDKALTRRFDAVIDFDRYTRDDLVEISVILLEQFLKKFTLAGRDMKLFKKIILNIDSLPSPGELSNMIKMSLAFSNPNEKFDYLRRLMKYVVDQPNDINTLRKKGFTLREIELLTGISKSQVSRELKESD